MDKETRGGRRVRKRKNEIVRAIITLDSGHVIEYEIKNGSIYRVDGLEIEEVETTLSIDQILQNARSMGSTVETFNAKQDKELQEKRKKDREETNEFLNAHDVQNKTMKRGTKMNKIANRRRNRRR
ncbi:MAG: hypothetical protein KBT34_09810 [Prevotella sp.]|nr:hypothetical protein [Candidatus Prevotella equi]